MTSEAFKLNDPNPWFSIGVKALKLAGKTFSDVVFIDNLKHENELLRRKLNWYVQNVGNYDYEYEKFEANDGNKSAAGKITDNNLSVHKSTTSYSSVSPDLQPKRKISLKTEKPQTSAEVPVKPQNPRKVEEKYPKALKIKLKLPEIPPSVTTKELSVRTVDLCNTLTPKDYTELVNKKEMIVKSPPLKLKPQAPPFVVIPKENLNFDNEQSKVVQDFPKPGTSKEVKSPSIAHKNLKFNPFARKRKQNPNNLDEFAEKAKEAPTILDISKSVQEIKETPFKLKLKLPTTVSEVTITNTKFTTPTGNVLLPPIISINTDIKSDNEIQPKEINQKENQEHLIPSRTSNEFSPDIEDQMKSIHEEKLDKKPSHADNSNLQEKSADSLTLTQEGMLELTQNELDEINIITAISLSSSSQSLKLSEELTDGSPVKDKHVTDNYCIQKQLDLQGSKGESENKVQVSSTDTDIDDSEEVNAEIIDEKSCGIENDVAQKRPEHTLASDDFEPDYEPDE